MCSRETSTSIAERARAADGSALALVLMAMAILSAAGVGLVLMTMTEVSVSANHAASRTVLFAAEAVLERSIEELNAAADWNVVLAGISESTFTDGAPGVRQLADGTSIDLRALTNLSNCGRTVTCSMSEVWAITPERPWGTSNPFWQLYAFAPVAALAPAGRIDMNLYTVAWVGDDPERDADVILVRAEAFGPGGAHDAIVAAIVRQAAAPALRLVGWRRHGA